MVDTLHDKVASVVKQFAAGNRMAACQTSRM